MAIKLRLSMKPEIKLEAIFDYLNGMSYREVGEKYKVDHKTVRRWVLNSGNKSRTRADALIIVGKRLRGVRRSPNTEFKKEQAPWNKDTKGVMKANRASFKKGERTSTDTEFKPGQEPWNKGILWSEMSGSNHPNWLGGADAKGYEGFSKQIKKVIRQRDNSTCKICGALQADLSIALDVHHIDYNKKNCKENNLISLCRSCHMKTNYNRAYWKKYLKEILCHLIN